MARENLGQSITSEIVAEATARFLASGGTIQRKEGAPEMNLEWQHSEFLSKMTAENGHLKAEDMVVDTNPMSGE